MDKNRADIAGGLVFVGFILCSLGLGIYFENLAVFFLMGLGAAFIGFGLIKAIVKH